MLSDGELIARVLTADDRAAFGELVLRHQSAVRNFLRQLTEGNDAQADDLAQDTFIEAYRSLSRYRGEARFSTWLFGIAHNRFRNAWRRERTARAAAERDSAAAEPAPSPARALDLGADLNEAIQTLSSDEQMAVHLFYHQDLPQQEIAAIAGWPLGTVKTHLARAKTKLRRLLRPWNPQT